MIYLLSMHDELQSLCPQQLSATDNRVENKSATICESYRLFSGWRYLPNTIHCIITNVSSSSNCSDPAYHIYHVIPNFDKSVMGKQKYRRTDRPTDQPTDGRTHPVIEMLGSIYKHKKQKYCVPPNF